MAEEKQAKRELTKEQREEVNRKSREAKAKQAAAQKAALAKIKELVDKTGDKSYADALRTIKPSLYGTTRAAGGPKAEPLYSIVAGHIFTKKSVNEDELFKMFRVGRKEAQALIKTALKKSKPEERKWVNFDDEKGVYSLVGVGIKPPANYTGPVPAEEKAEAK